MKKLYLLLFLLPAVFAVNAQSAKQVQWEYSAKKIADKVYEVHMTATIGDDYHLYAQDAGVEGPLPTTFKFTGNPLAVTDGKVKEAGKVVRKFETAWNGSVNYYEKTVDFIQVVKLKGNIKTNLAGSVEFMVCNDNRCLPPSTVAFKVNIGG
jgi:thiol:disulfide interchange protein DsbD